MLDRFLSTLSIVSRIPVKLPFKFDSSRMDFYLPLTGIFPALLGFLLFTFFSFFFDFSGPSSPPGIAALVVVVILIAQYLGFNLFHLDGLMDTADAFLGAAEREKRAAILKDSRVGVYGFFAGAAALGLKAVLLMSLFPFARLFPALVFSYPLWGRTSAALVPCMVRPLNSGGLGALAKDSRAYRCFLGAALALLLWTSALAGLSAFSSLIDIFPPAPMNHLPAALAPALCLFAVCPLAALCYARLYGKSLGGYTGDTMGAVVETSEILCGSVSLAVLFLTVPL